MAYVLPDSTTDFEDLNKQYSLYFLSSNINFDTNLDPDFDLDFDSNLNLDSNLAPTGQVLSILTLCHTLGYLVLSPFIPAYSDLYSDPL